LRDSLREYERATLKINEDKIDEIDEIDEPERETSLLHPIPSSHPAVL
jgi:hypothetical protein